MTRVRAALFVGIMIAVLSPGWSPAEGQTTGGAPDGLVWLALGDSYSSGEGLRFNDQEANPTFAPDGSPGGVTCERGTGSTSVNNGNGSRAYAKVAYDALRSDWVDSHFELQACTGAISNQIHAQYGLWRSSDSKADIVTSSMGGNNIGFASLIFGCIGVSVEGGVTALGGAVVSAGAAITLTALAPWVGCEVPEDELRGRIDDLFQRQPGGSGPFDTQTLADMYRQLVDDAMNPGGHVVIVGYPNAVEESSRWSLWWFEGNRCQRIRRSDVAMLRSVAGYLNQQLALLAEDLDGYGGVHFHWLDVSQVYENEIGRHGLCTGDPWINGITLGVAGPQSGRLPGRLMRSFHPTQDGHDATGAALAELIQTFDWSTRAGGNDLAGQDRSPRWDELRSASIPSLCGHEPTTLVDGQHPGLSGNQGHFSLIKEPWGNSEPLIIYDLPSPTGLLTAVVASCHLGGVDWPNLVVFFDTDVNVVASTFLDSRDGFDWPAIGLDAPARSGIDGLQIEGDELVVAVTAYSPGDPRCCASGGTVQARLKVIDGEIVPIHPTTTSNPDQNPPPSGVGTCEEQVMSWLRDANEGTDSVGVRSTYGENTVLDLIESYGLFDTERIRCWADGAFDAPPEAERTVLVNLEAGWHIALHLQEDSDGIWTTIAITEVGGGL